MLCITNQNNTIECQVTLPYSKSVLNRLLVIQHLSGLEDTHGFESEATDVAVMQNLLQKIQDNRKIAELTEINTGNAGTVMRFLTSVLAITPGTWLVTGSDRMQKRPVGPLTSALQGLGAEIIFTNTDGYPPFSIRGNPHLKGGTVKPDSGVSSQFISSLMMVAPLLKGGLTIELQGDTISEPYIRMTQDLMQKAGVNVSFEGNIVFVEEGKYRKTDFYNLAERDWSAAAFWYELASFSPGAKIQLNGLGKESTQGDSVLPDIFSKLGVNTTYSENGLILTKSEDSASEEFNYCFSGCPDLAQPVIVSCAALGVKGHFTGLKTLRIKETDRINALKSELTRLGYGIQVVGDEIFLDGKIKHDRLKTSAGAIKCYDDHRMAMSFAPLAMFHSQICLDEPNVVNKSYPGFWKDMKKAGFYFVK
jgi:3-phosphoshikimate 1-carboxyvinyltransferase